MLRAVLIMAVGFGFGFASNQLPAPESFGPMWVASLAAPYALLPFLAGAWVFPSRWSAVLAGVMVEFAAFFGYYAELIVDTGSSWGNLVSPSNPWLFFEVFAGVAFGYLGHLWWRRGSVSAGLVCAAVPLLEAIILFFGINAWVLRRIPVLNLYPPVYPRTSWNVGLWAVEALVGLCLAWLVFRRRGRRSG